MNTPHHPQSGWSLVEAMAALTVLSITLGTAIPSFQTTVDRQRVLGAAGLLESDLQLARSEAVLRQRNVRISFRSESAGSCYVVHAGPAGACTCSPAGAPVCAGGVQALRHAGFPQADGIRINSNTGSMTFGHVQGTVTPTGTVKVLGRDHSVHLITNVMGRVRACAAVGEGLVQPTC
jgi:type IV fimbrial biogenesis protein FimT